MAAFSIMIVITTGTLNAQVRKIDGYKGIWFDLGQLNAYGSKYSGGLGTYTAKHRPLAIYAEKADKTFFVYGGTTAEQDRHLLAMISYYDHETGLVPKPTIVHDKLTVNDPHDNPSLSIDDDGHIWVFVSGRGRARPGYKYRSRQPYDINNFEQISETEFTYPQPVWISGKGFIFCFTKYTNGRELYWSTSDITGRTWTEDKKLAGMGGQYQMTSAKGERVITAFNMHPGTVDKRTNLYFLQTTDFGRTWQTIDGTTAALPLMEALNVALVRDYQSEGRLVYLKDITFDTNDNPVLLYITSGYHQAGPESDPRIWTIAHWSGSEWLFHEITHSTANYDMGSLYIEGENLWRIIAPTEPGPQYNGTGGEIAVWESSDQGKSWKKIKNITHRSERNHGYVRRPENAHPDFYAYWADGNPNQFTRSYLYFADKTGTKIRQLPYEMNVDYAEPVLMPPATLK